MISSVGTFHRLDPEISIIYRVDPITGTLQHSHHDLPHHRIVIDHQRAAPFSRTDLDLFRSGFNLLHPLTGGEQCSETSAHSQFRFQFQHSSMGTNNTQHRCQAQPPPGELGREEGFKTARLRLLRHPHATVLDLKNDVLPFLQLGACSCCWVQFIYPDKFERGLHFHRMKALNRSFRSVDDQIHHHLLNLSLITSNAS